VVNLEVEQPDALVDRGDSPPPPGPAAALGLALFRALGRDDHDLEEAACELWVSAGPDDQPPGRPAWLRQALALIADELAGPLRLADVAARLDLHPVHVARTFRRLLGTSVGEHVARARVLRACELLRGTHATITDVAAATGFADHAHLTRTFRRLTGLTPSAYRAGG